MVLVKVVVVAVQVDLEKVKHLIVPLIQLLHLRRLTDYQLQQQLFQ